jgi:hypothetical protein
MLTASAVVLALTACGDDESTSGSGASSNNTQDCTATLHFLQKDAYRDGAGRSSPLWPPHTTTVLDYYCQENAAGDATNVNHGTAPDDTDAMGQVILDETGTVAVSGPMDEI